VLRFEPDVAQTIVVSHNSPNIWSKNPPILITYHDGYY
jgi:hypothetical protein